jgi:hypothetical protein
MPSSQGRNSRKSVALLQSAALLAVLAQPVAAATAVQLSAPVQVLAQYRIVRGDEKGDLKLGSKITRGEMATILVRAKGLEGQVASSMDLGLFSDTKTHWSRGYVNVARMNGLILGYEDGTFRPDAEVTYAEALTMVLRLVDQNPSATNWPLSVLLMAQEKNILPPGVSNFQSLSAPAIRLDVFTSLGQALTEIKTPEGQTYLQKYVDREAPNLALSSLPAATENASLTLSGTAKDAVSVMVNGTAVTLTGETFTTQLNLNYGENQFVVVAADAAGNSTTKSLTITRNAPVARFEVTAPAKVGIGTKTTFTVKGYNSQGQEVALAGVTAKVEGNIGTFDLQTRTFTASNQVGKGRLILSSGPVTKTVDLEVVGQAATASQLYIRPVQTVSSTKEMTVEVEVRDAMGNRVDDYGRSVMLTASGQTGLVVTPVSATTNNGVATFKVKGSTEGTIALTATSGSLSGDTTTAVFATPIQVVLVAENPNLTIGGTPNGSRIRAELRDENGNLVTNNTASDITISLTLTGEGFLTDSFLTIRRGLSNSVDSGDSGLVEASGIAGSGIVTGRLTSNHTYTVTNTSVSYQVPSVGGGSRMEILTPPSALNKGDLGVYVLRVVDSRGATIPNGSYAFQLKIDTSNNDPKVNGIPDGVTVTLGDTVNVVDDGKAEGTAGDTADVIGRTVGGQATIKLRYAKGGSVTITPVLIGSSVTATADNGVPGMALPSTVFEARSATAVYRHTPADLAITVDSDLGADQPTGSIPNNPGRYFTVRAKVLDADGRFAPAANIPVIIAPVGNPTATTLTGSTIVNAVNGVAEFRVYATTNIGTDSYTITSPTLGSMTPKTVSLNVNAGPVTVAPVILAARGVENGAPHANNRVAVTDTHLELDLQTASSVGQVSVMVYQAGTSNLIYQSPVVNMASTTPQIRIPREKLIQGNAQYDVVFNNGTGNGPRSAPTPVITTARELSHIQISTARYNADTHVLSIYTSGLNPVGAIIQPSKLTITNGTSPTTLNLAGATAQVVNSGQVNLTLTSAQQAFFEASPDFAGRDVNLRAEAGWYQSETGDASVADLTGNMITPTAYISSVVYDKLNRQLIVEGAGFDTGNVDLNDFSILDPSTAQTFTFTPANVSGLIVRTANKLVFSLTSSPTAGTGLLDDGMKFDGADNILETANGWIYVDATSNAKGQTVPLYTQVRIDSVSYASGVLSITGAGFSTAGSALNLAQLKIVDADAPSAPLALEGATSAQIVSDGLIQITLTSVQVSTLTGGGFSGSNIYLQGAAGWLTLGGRSATPIPTNQRVGGL